MKSICGFSLIELMMVLSVIGILSIVTLAGIKFFQPTAQAEVLSSQFLRAIHLARSEAILRHEKIYLCGSSDQVNCSNDWQNGYIIRTEENVIYHLKNISLKGIFHLRFFPKGQEQLQFLATGLLNSQNGTFWFCPADAIKPAWAIVLNQAARARVVYPDKNGEVRDDKGVGLVC